MFGDGDDDKYFRAQKIKVNISCSLELDSGSGVIFAIHQCRCQVTSDIHSHFV